MALNNRSENCSMVTINIQFCFFGFALILGGCSEKPSAWIVVDLETLDGKTAQMAFKNPAVPDMTMAECERSLEGALPTLVKGIESAPQTKGSRVKSTKCMLSIKDPLKPNDAE